MQHADAVIEVSNVTTRFGAHVVHDAVDFEVRRAEIFALVGGSGSGKSTLARLLLRFYDVSDGSIKVDQQDIRNVTAKSLRKAIGVVPQETLLFNDTIAYNIAYGRGGATMEQIVADALFSVLFSVLDI